MNSSSFPSQFNINIRTHEKLSFLSISPKKKIAHKFNKKNYFVEAANTTNPIIVMRIPFAPKQRGMPAPKDHQGPSPDFIPWGL